MIYRKSLSEDQARYVIQHSELPTDAAGSRRCVALVATQGWCPDWRMVDRWMDRLVKKNEPEDIDIDVYTVVYDREPFFDDFRVMKETTWKNPFVPYIRYYVDGEFVRDSNQVRPEQFLDVYRAALTATQG